jgi:hypothetical protein
MGSGYSQVIHKPKKRRNPRFEPLNPLERPWREPDPADFETGDSASIH